MKGEGQIDPPPEKTTVSLIRVSKEKFLLASIKMSE